MRKYLTLPRKRLLNQLRFFDEQRVLRVEETDIEFRTNLDCKITKPLVGLASVSESVCGNHLHFFAEKYLLDVLKNLGHNIPVVL